MRFYSLDIKLQSNSVKMEWISDTWGVQQIISSAVWKHGKHLDLAFWDIHKTHKLVESWGVISSTRSELFIPQRTAEKKNYSISGIYNQYVPRYQKQNKNNPQNQIQQITSFTAKRGHFQGLKQSWTSEDQQLFGGWLLSPEASLIPVFPSFQSSSARNTVDSPHQRVLPHPLTYWI